MKNSTRPSVRDAIASAADRCSTCRCFAVGSSKPPPAPELDPGNDQPAIRVRPPGPQSRTWLTRHRRASAPMGPRLAPRISAVRADVPASTIVLATGSGSNVTDVDGNRYVDLAQGFG